MTEGAMLKKITEAMKDLVTEANFDCSTTGISLQAMVRASACAHLTFMRVPPSSMAPMSLRCPPRLRSVQPGSDVLLALVLVPCTRELSRHARRGVRVRLAALVLMRACAVPAVGASGLEPRLACGAAAARGWV